MYVGEKKKYEIVCVWEGNKQNKIWQQKIRRKNMNNKIQQVRDQQAREERVLFSQKDL